MKNVNPWYEKLVFIVLLHFMKWKASLKLFELSFRRWENNVTYSAQLLDFWD